MTARDADRTVAALCGRCDLGPLLAPDSLIRGILAVPPMLPPPLSATMRSSSHVKCASSSGSVDCIISGRLPADAAALPSAVYSVLWR